MRFCQVFAKGTGTAGVYHTFSETTRICAVCGQNFFQIGQGMPEKLPSECGINSLIFATFQNVIFFTGKRYSMAKKG